MMALAVALTAITRIFNLFPDRGSQQIEMGAVK